MPESPAAVAARQQRQMIGGLVAGAMFLGFIGYAFTKWFRETEQLLTRPNRDERPWDRI